MRVARVQRLLHHVVALGTQPHRRAVLTNLREYADTHMLLVCGGMRTDMQQPQRRAVRTNLREYADTHMVLVCGGMRTRM